MKRREFIAGLGGAAVVGPRAAWAQQARMPVIGFLNGASATELSILVDGFRKGLAEVGYFEGHNILVEYRWADGRYDRLPVLASELVQRPVEVLVSTGGTTSAVIAKAATSTIPVVFQIGGDPVDAGLVTSLNRPGGNLTGVGSLLVELTPKQFELVKELLPNATLIALLVNPQSANARLEAKNAHDAAKHLGRSIMIVNASNDQEVGMAFATTIERGAGALMVLADPFMFGRQDMIIALAARYSVPTFFPWDEAVRRGGLISYGPNLPDVFRLVGVYTGRILKGEKPAELPVAQPTKFDLVINLKTAKALGITVPQTLQVAADEVIE